MVGALWLAGHMAEFKIDKFMEKTGEVSKEIKF